MLKSPSAIIERAMRLSGAIGVGRSMTAEEQADGLVALNEMVDQWAIQRLTIFLEARTLFDLVSGTQTYTIGDGGDFDVARPVFMNRASVITTDDNDLELELPISVLTTQDWQTQVPVKATPSPLPLAVYNDYAYPLSNLTFYPKPNVGDLQVALYLPTAVAQFDDAATEVNLAPGYAEAMTYNLAVRFANEFGLDIPPAVAVIAGESFANIKRANIRPEVLRCDRALRPRQRGRYNWISDTFR